jgi:hypothetical protein
LGAVLLEIVPLMTGAGVTPVNVILVLIPRRGVVGLVD